MIVFAVGKLVDRIISIRHSKPELAPFQDNQRKSLRKLNLRVKQEPSTLNAKDACQNHQDTVTDFGLSSSTTLTKSGD